MYFYQPSVGIPERQHTITNIISYKGIGLHSGSVTEIHILPGAVDQGIEFHVMDEWNYVATIPATIYYTSDGSFRTELCNNGRHIDTVEHLLAALQMAGIDNAIINVWGKEIPIMDGSSKGWLDLILSSGKSKQTAPRKYIKILRDVKVGTDDAWCKIEPSVTSEFIVDYNLNYSHPLIGEQSISVEVCFNTFSSDLADARTFGFIKDIDKLKSAGLAAGASLDNTVVFDDDSVINETGLRWHNEPVRHKVLDVIGDLSLIGHPIIGKFTGYRSGHKLNQSLVSALMNNLESWDFCTVNK